MKRIIIDARELTTSTGRPLKYLLRYLQEADTDLSHRYVVLLKPADYDTWQPHSKRFIKVVCPYKEFTYAEQFGFFWQLLRLKADLVHFYMVQQPVLYQGNVVTTMHDLTTLRFGNPSKNRLVFSTKQRIYRLVNYIAAHKSRAIITPSAYVKDDVAKIMRLNSRKITVIYEAGEPLEAAAEPVADLEHKRFIMYVGRPNPHKNLGRLIEAYSLVKQSVPDLQLVLVGKEDTLFKQHIKEVDRQGIPDVHFTGYLDDGKLRWLYEHCDAYVFPSLSEGFGLPGLEAMAHGAPVISSNATCLPEIYGDAARYFDPHSVDDMAAAIKAIVTKPEMRNALIDLGYKQVKKYSWRRLAEQTLAIYNQILAD